MAANKKREILLRAYLGFAFIFLLGLAIIGRAFYIQTYQGKYYRSLADSLTIFPKTILAERGNIYSEDGRLLATTLPTFDIRIDFKTTYLHKEIFTDNVDSVSLLLTKMFPEKNARQYKSELVAERKKKSRYYLLKRNVTYNQLNEMKLWPMFREGQYKSGMIALQEDKRLNPFVQLAKRSIGSINDNGGVFGIEKQFDSILKGKEGTVMVQKIAGGVTIPLDSKEEIAPQPGRDIYTTLDVELQDVAEDALMRALQHHAADHGCVVLMEVKTGKIKAMANLGLVKDSTYGEIANYAVGEATEPGSTFKLASYASMMEDGLITANTKVFVGDGHYTVYNKTISDHDKPETPELTVQRAFEESSNVAVATLADKNYSALKEKFYKHLVDFGFSKPINIELPGAAKPILHDPKTWSGVSAAYIAHGYELAITPLHTLMFYNAVANNGTMVQPYMIAIVKEYNATVDSTTTTVLNPKICSAKTIQQLRGMLVGVVENGTATNLKTDYLHVAGKTGTAVISQGKKGYTSEGKKDYRASFCGYFPAENPQYSMIVMISSPSANGYYGNVVAGSIFKEVADKVYSLNLNMHKAVNEQVALENKMPRIQKGNSADIKNIYAFLGTKVNNVNTEWATASTNGNKVLLAENEINNQTVPDVTGMSLKDALYQLESLGLKVLVSGRGNVIKQSIVGEKISKGMSISIELK
ncbi:MAG: penicillin-binding protein [Bacteroidetes bacterium]|nr:penicillin-binding protein [Bacteroidota bacterium]